MKDNYLFIIFNYLYFIKDMNNIKFYKLYGVFYMFKHFINK